MKETFKKRWDYRRIIQIMMKTVNAIQILQKIYIDIGKIPEQCSILKKDATSCENYRSIALFNKAYKILAMVIKNRLSVKINEVVGEYQAGFMRDEWWETKYLYYRDYKQRIIHTKRKIMLSSYTLSRPTVSLKVKSYIKHYQKIS